MTVMIMMTVTAEERVQRLVKMVMSIKVEICSLSSTF